MDCLQLLAFKGLNLTTEGTEDLLEGRPLKETQSDFLKKLGGENFVQTIFNTFPDTHIFVKDLKQQQRDRVQ